MISGFVIVEFYCSKYFGELIGVIFVFVISF